MNILKRIGVTLAVALLGFASVFVAGSPAQASTVNGCTVTGSEVRVCFYNWIDWNKGGGFWRRSNGEIQSYANDCASMENHYWDIGGIIYDSPPSSFVINRDPGTSAGYTVRFYDWVDCNYAGGYLEYYVPPGSQVIQDDNLTTVPAANNWSMNSNWYNRISSVKVCTTAC